MGTIVVNNSYCELVHFGPETTKHISDILTTHNDIEHEKQYLIGQIRFLAGRKDGNPKIARAWGFLKKKLKDLLATEYVHWLVDDKFPTGHLNIVFDVLEALEEKYEIEDLRKIPEKRHDFILCKDFHEPRYYQREMHEIGMREKRGVFESAVGTGKTDVLMRLVWALGVNSLIVVPSKPLLKQLLPLLEEHFGPRHVIALNSKELSQAKLRKLRKRPIRVINIQSLAAAMKKGTLLPLIEDVEALFVDEIHHAGSKSYTDLLKALEHVFYRYGFTGTFLRNDSKTLDMWGFLSNKLYSYPAWKAIEDKFLTPIEVKIHECEGIAKRAYQAEYRANYCGSEKRKPVALLNAIRKIFKEDVKEGQRVLILVNRKDQCGKIIHEFLNSIGRENTYISGDSEDDDITDAIKDFNAKEIDVLIGSQVIGEGIDIRSADHLIMAQGGKSEISIVQAAGRLVRLFPGKSIGILHDFHFLDTKYMSKHLTIRKDIYKRNLLKRKPKDDKFEKGENS